MNEINFEVGPSELAMLMLQWESEQRKADQTRRLIEGAVMELAKSVTVGNIEARYSKGRRKLDWKTPIMLHDRYEDEVPNYTEQIPEEIIPARIETDWSGLAKLLDVVAVVLDPGEPSVNVKLIE